MKHTKNIDRKATSKDGSVCDFHCVIKQQPVASGETAKIDKHIDKTMQLWLLNIAKLSTEEKKKRNAEGNPVFVFLHFILVSTSEMRLNVAAIFASFDVFDSCVNVTQAYSLLIITAFRCSFFIYTIQSFLSACHKMSFECRETHQRRTNCIRQQI